MANVKETAVIKIEPDQQAPASQIGQIEAEIQSRLFSNYKQALEGDFRFTAAACLLAAKSFSGDNQQITTEICKMIETDGDFTEPTKRFANILNHILTVTHNDDKNDAIADNQNIDVGSNELTNSKFQIKEDIKILFNELKSQYLKLKSTKIQFVQHATAARATLMPRMSISERSAELADSLASNKTSMYLRIFDNLTDEIKSMILLYPLRHCIDPLEKCKLMMLGMSVVNKKDIAASNDLLQELARLSDLKDVKPEDAQNKSVAFYGRSFLALDAIPIVLNSCPISSLHMSFEDICDRIVAFFVDYCLETAGIETRPSELSRSVKREIRSRSLRLEGNYSASDKQIEDHLMISIDIACEKYIESCPESTSSEKLGQIHKIITDNQDSGLKFHRLLEAINSMNLSDDIPDNILFPTNETAEQASISPSKARGRPKRAQVITSPDDEKRRILQRQARDAHYVFYSLIRHLLSNVSDYLKSARTRILLNFSNPLGDLIELKLESKVQRPTRHKSSSQQSNNSDKQATNQKPKRAKFINQDAKLSSDSRKPEKLRELDAILIRSLVEAYKCMDYLKSNQGVLGKLWQKYSVPWSSQKWFNRLIVDSFIVTGQYEKAECLLKSYIEDQDRTGESQSDEGAKEAKVRPNEEVAKLRHLVQQFSCLIQLTNESETFATLGRIIDHLKLIGLMNNQDDNFTNENSPDESVVVVQTRDHVGLGFLYFEPASIIRYCANFLSDLLSRLIDSPSVTDTLVGHAIVLSQLDWPRRRRIYRQCISWIRNNKPKSATPQVMSNATKFTYQDFFNYVYNPSIIEDFMAILCDGYTLDIKSSTSPQLRSANSPQAATGRGTRSAKVIQTRGVNKTLKVDLKLALTAQMKSSSTLIGLDTMGNFIKACLLPQLESLA